MGTGELRNTLKLLIIKSKKKTTEYLKNRGIDGMIVLK
jgi:hypothetical protein